MAGAAGAGVLELPPFFASALVLEVASHLCSRLADVASLSAIARGTRSAMATALGGCGVAGPADDVDVCCSVLAFAAAVRAFPGGRAFRGRRSPLSAAAQVGRTDVVRFLVHEARTLGGRVLLDVQDTDGATALHYAALEGQVHVCSVLLQAKASVDVPDWRGVRPLHLAAEGGHANVVTTLLKSRANATQRDGEGNTALHLASEAKNVDAVAVLAASGANPLATNRDGISPVSLARESGCRVLMDALFQPRCLKEDADPGLPSLLAPMHPFLFPRQLLAH